MKLSDLFCLNFRKTIVNAFLDYYQEISSIGNNTKYVYLRIISRYINNDINDVKIKAKYEFLIVSFKRFIHEKIMDFIHFEYKDTNLADLPRICSTVEYAIRGCIRNDFTEKEKEIYHDICMKFINWIFPDNHLNEFENTGNRIENTGNRNDSNTHIYNDSTIPIDNDHRRVGREKTRITKIQEDLIISYSSNRLYDYAESSQKTYESNLRKLFAEGKVSKKFERLRKNFLEYLDKVYSSFINSLNISDSVKTTTLETIKKYVWNELDKSNSGTYINIIRKFNNWLKEFEYEDADNAKDKANTELDTDREKLLLVSDDDDTRSYYCSNSASEQLDENNDYLSNEIDKIKSKMDAIKKDTLDILKQILLIEEQIAKQRH